MDVIQPSQQPLPSQPTDPAVQKPPNHFPLLLFLLSSLLLLLVSSTVFLAYQNMQLQKQIAIVTAVTPTPHPTILPKPTTKYSINNHPIKSGWKLAQGTYFSIAYPSEYLFESPFWSDAGFLETFSITSPSRLSSIQIGTEYSFPFGGPLGLVEQQKSTIVIIGNNPYTGEETSYGKSKNDLYSNITSVILSDKNIQFTNKENVLTTEPVLILFGNDYPLSPRNQTTTAQSSNYRQYVSEKPVLLQILSTFKFLDQNAATPTCTPRPACLDATPRCMIPETEGMCPYSCPASGWVDCMPGPEAKPECAPEAMSWYKVNCPNFQGGAL